MKQKSNDRKTLRWLWTRAKGKKRYVIALIMTNTLLNIFSVGFALFLSGIVDSAVDGDWNEFYIY